MRRDLIIGFIFTVTLEFLVAWGGDITHFKPKPKIKEDEPKIEIVMPKIEPDEPEVVEDQPPVPQDI
ncbi:MAG: energy transducer TonB, partial [Opitutaceae bacterium]